MFKSKQILFALIMTTLFLALTVFAVLSYNGDEDNNRAYQLAINQKTYIFLDSTINFFNNIAPKKQEVSQEEDDLAKVSLIDRIKGRILIKRKSEGLSISIKNSEGEYLESILPIFKKRAD